ncbi:MAG: cell division protein FtsA [Candidatus Poribacteria bacterium]
MASSNIITGLDVGTSKVVAIIAEIDENSQVEILGVGNVPSKGLINGTIINLDSTTDSIRKAIDSAEMMAGTKVKSVHVGLAGEHIRGINSKGTAIIPGKKNNLQIRQISSSDVERAIKQAKSIETPNDRKVITTITRGFIVDDRDGITEPVGIFGTRLDALVHVVTGSVTAVQNLIKAVENANVNVESIELQPLASSESVLYKDEKEMGVMLIDIGAGTTDIIIYVEGAVWYTAVIPFGGEKITKSIAIMLNTPKEKAEDIKKESACALTNEVDSNEMISVPGIGGRESYEVPKRTVAEVVEPLLKGLFEYIRKEVESSGYKGVTHAGVVITGGCAMLKSIDKLAERVFGQQTRIGYPRQLNGLYDRVKDPSFATCIGLVLKGAERNGLTKGNSLEIKPNQFLKIFAKMKNWLSGE